MAQYEKGPIIRGNMAWPFPFLGSSIARAEITAMALVGQRALFVLGYGDDLRVPEPHLDWNPPVVASPALETAVDAFISSLEASTRGFKNTESVRHALLMVRDFEKRDHELFMSAMYPSKSHDWAHMSDHQRRNRLLHAVRQAVRGPDFNDIQDAARIALLQVVDQTSPWRCALNSVPRSKALLSRRYIADTDRQREINTWRAGMSLRPMLEPSQYTDSNSLSIRKAVRSILCMPRLGAILRQQIATGQKTQPVRIVGPDGQHYTADELEQDPRYAGLLSSDGVLVALASQDMKTLIASADKSRSEAVISQARIDYLLMAQRIAIVAIHTSVRDSIQYGLGGWNRPASEVLRLRRGSCFCSSSLAVALGRAAGIPCGVVRLFVELPGYFGLALGPNQMITKERVSVHYYVGWITLQPLGSQVSWQAVCSDPGDDYNMAAGVMFNHPHTRPVVFNGAQNGLLGIPADYLYDRVGPLAVIDELAEKKAVVSPPADDRQRLLRFVTQQTASISLDEAILEYVKQPTAVLHTDPDAHQVYKSIYRFMTECHPTHAGKSHYPFGWLCASEQSSYLDYLCDSEIPFDHPVKNVVNYVLGKQNARRDNLDNSLCDKLPIASMCSMLGLPEVLTFRLMSFHEHLLSSITLTLLNLTTRFYASTENIRSCTEVQMEFEAWLNHQSPTLASLHRQEIAFNKDYEYSTIVYLLGRLCIQEPLAERQALGQFMDMIEKQPSLATSEETLDQRLKLFLGPEGPIEAFIPQRGDGLLKPYGLLYSLWKAYILESPQESVKILRQIHERSKHQKRHEYQDWFSSKVSSNDDRPVLRSQL